MPFAVYFAVSFSSTFSILGGASLRSSRGTFRAAFDCRPSLDQAAPPVEGLQIPNPGLAIIDRAKIQDYLLSATHPMGHSKFVFFVNLGYSPQEWWRLDRDLRMQHLTMDAKPLPSTHHGQKYEIRARMKGPIGRSASVVSVWIVRTDENFPRFVTAYPEGEG